MSISETAKLDLKNGYVDFQDLVTSKKMHGRPGLIVCG